MLRQRTLHRAVSIAGIGLHSGEAARVTLSPAPAGVGIVFRRAGRNSVLEIPARAHLVVDTTRCTCLGLVGDAWASVGVATVEHLLAALAGMGVDNAYVDVDGPEVPIMDGSAGPFVALIEAAGLVVQDAPRRFLRIRRQVTVEEGDKLASFLPFDGFRVSFSIDYGLPGLDAATGQAAVDFATDSFAGDISRARTFGFMHEVRQLRAGGLARGGSLDNAVVVDEGRILNPGGLRCDDEFVRHKILDALGDLSLLGCPLIGEYRAHKSGHTLNNLAVRTLLATPDAWELVTFSDHELPSSGGEPVAMRL